MVSKKSKKSDLAPEFNTKGPHQDGVQQNVRPMQHTASDEFQKSMEPPHANSDLNEYPLSAGDHGMSTENYGKMNNAMSNAPLQNFNRPYRGNFVNETHGVGNGNEYPHQNPPFSQYGQHNMRPSTFPHSGMPRAPAMQHMQGRPPGCNTSVGMSGPNVNSNPQRFTGMSGPSIQQQGGPTPTLNQLLQNPNPSQRYPSGYGDYGMGQQKRDSEGLPANQTFPGPQGWGAGNQRPGMGMYQQGQSFRNPVSSNHCYLRL